MTYQGISSKWHCRLYYGYTRNRVRGDSSNALSDYINDVDSWARKSKKRMREHCNNLLHVLTNPSMLEAGLDGMKWRDWLRNMEIGTTNNEVDAKNSLITEDNKWNILRFLGNAIKKRTFIIGDYHQIEIPKIGKPGMRLIEVPPFETRIVARTILRILEPILDPDFYQFSIGFRPNHSINHGLAIASVMHKRGHTHWVNVDIRDAFGSVSLDRVFEVLNSRLFNSPIIPLVRKLNGKKRKAGLTQGVPTSPLLLNLYLDHFLDQWWIKKQGGGPNFVRYADDIAIFCKSRDEAISAYQTFSQQLKVIGFQIKESESEGVKNLESGDTVDWLGFQAQNVSGELKFHLGDSAWDKLEHRLVESQSKKNEPYYTLDIDDIPIEIIESWLRQKAPGIDQSRFGSVANRLNQLIEKYSLNVDEPLDLEFVKGSWEIGMKSNNRAFDTVQKWLGSWDTPIES